MKETSEEARDRYYKEVSIHLTRSGFTVLSQREGLLPLEWNGASLCRITAGGGAQYRAEELELDGAAEAFHQATEISATTAEYMRIMDAAPPLKATGLVGDYRLLADYNGTALAGHPTNRGVEFVTWEWNYQHTGMWQGHYYGSNYVGAKQDFAIRSGLIPQTLIFEQEELDEFYAYLIELSVALPPLDEEHKTDDRLVKGCQSHVWLDMRVKDGAFSFNGDSDTLILKGVLYLLREIFNGEPPDAVAAAKARFLEQTEIMATFDADRQKGIGFIIRHIQRFAAEHSGGIKK